MKANPRRDLNPTKLVDKQINSATNFLKKAALSRGQRKRLMKKEKFVSQKLIEL
jgi:hypothetical protein